MVRLSAVVVREGKWYVARGVEVELASQGRTIEEALRHLKEAFGLWMKHAEASDLDAVRHADASFVTLIEA